MKGSDFLKYPSNYQLLNEDEFYELIQFYGFTPAYHFIIERSVLENIYT